MIETKRLIIRPWQIDDAEALYKYASDSRVSELALWPTHESAEMSREVIEDFFIPFSSYAIVLKATNEPVGCIGLVPQGGEHHELADNEREVGYWIGHPYWGQGITTETLMAMIEFYRDSMGLKSLLITTDSKNIGSQRVAEKCGFKYVEDYENDGVPSKVFRLTLKVDEFALICEYFSKVERQGPGSDNATLQALDFIKQQTHKEITDIADLGCGTGASTLLLAQNTNAHVTALDLFPDFIGKLRLKAVAEGLSDRLTTHVGDMSALPFGDKQFDIIWSEGAIYNIGFENGLRGWRRYIKDGGFVAVTEISWLTDERPDEINQFWNEGYPGMDTIPNKIAQMQRCGYKLIAAFTLPEDCWTTNYYIPQRQAQAEFLQQHPNDASAQELIASQRQEAELYQKYKDYYSYVFYVGQKN